MQTMDPKKQAPADDVAPENSDLTAADPNEEEEENKESVGEGAGALVD